MIGLSDRTEVDLIEHPSPLGGQPRAGSVRVTHWPVWAVVALWLLVPMGWALLVWNFTKPISLFIDEVRVLRTIVESDVMGFAAPLSDHQVAPMGFLVATRGFVAGFGLSEWSARLLAVVAAGLSLPLFAWLVRRVAAPLPGLVVMLGMVGSQEWLVQSCRVKPYTLDVLFTLLGLAVGLRLLEQRCGWRGALAASLVASLGVWFSIPFYLVMSAVGLVLLIAYLRQGRRRELAWLALPAVCGMLSGAVHYFWVLRPQTVLGDTGRYMNAYWSFTFPPMPWVSPQAWVVRVADGLADATGLTLPGLVLGLVVVGMLPRWRDPRSWLLACPIVLAVVACTARWYPLDDRLALFLAPAVLLLLASGLETLRDRLGGAVGLVLVLVLSAVLVSGTVAGRGLAPFSDDIVPVILHVHNESTPDQRVYLYYGTQPPYDFYTEYLRPGLAFPEDRLIRGVNHRDDWTRYADEFEALRGGGEVWIIMSHVVHGRGIDEGQFFEMILDRHGKRLVEYNGWRARAILWRADPAPAGAASAPQE